MFHSVCSKEAPYRYSTIGMGLFFMPSFVTMRDPISLIGVLSSVRHSHSGSSPFPWRWFMSVKSVPLLHSQSHDRRVIAMLHEDGFLEAYIDHELAPPGPCLEAPLSIDSLAASVASGDRFFLCHASTRHNELIVWSVSWEGWDKVLDVQLGFRALSCQVEWLHDEKAFYLRSGAGFYRLIRPIETRSVSFQWSFPWIVRNRTYAMQQESLEAPI